MMNDILNKKEKIVVVGLGYVGLPLAVMFAEAGVEVIGFEINGTKVEKYKNGNDPTNEIGSERLKKVNIEYTCDPTKIKDGKFIIIAVPTPVNGENIPDLFPIESASKVVGQNMSLGSIVVYESTVYPGVTEEICIPILEKESGFKCGQDFKIGYSPERVNPGDKVNTIDNIVKIVSGMDKETLDIIASVYEIIVKAGVYKASSIKVAEAAKVIENTQRDVNIAFMNELSIIFDLLGIDTKEVLEAAGTKWNFLKFNPGLVGGHCIGVDPYYLTYKSGNAGYEPKLIIAARQLNEEISDFIVNKLITKLSVNNISIEKAKILVMGLTFKENVPDLRNSKVINIIKKLRNYNAEVIVVDPHANKEEVNHECEFELSDLATVKDIDAVILAVSHNEYRNIELSEIKKLYNPLHNKKILIDVKGIKDKKLALENNFDYWRM